MPLHMAKMLNEKILIIFQNHCRTNKKYSQRTSKHRRFCQNKFETFSKAFRKPRLIILSKVLN